MIPTNGRQAWCGRRISALSRADIDGVLDRRDEANLPDKPEWTAQHAGGVEAHAGRQRRAYSHRQRNSIDATSDD